MNAVHVFRPSLTHTRTEAIQPGRFATFDSRIIILLSSVVIDTELSDLVLCLRINSLPISAIINLSFVALHCSVAVYLSDIQRKVSFIESYAD